MRADMRRYIVTSLRCRCWIDVKRVGGTRYTWPEVEVCAELGIRTLSVTGGRGLERIIRSNANPVHNKQRAVHQMGHQLYSIALTVINRSTSGPWRSRVNNVAEEATPLTGLTRSCISRQRPEARRDDRIDGPSDHVEPRWRIDRIGREEAEAKPQGTVSARHCLLNSVQRSTRSMRSTGVYEVRIGSWYSFVVP